MKRAVKTLEEILGKLKQLEDQSVYNWLMADSQVQLVLNGGHFTMTINTLNGNILAGNCFKLSFGANSAKINEGGVYIFFNPLDGEAYVGSALSFHTRLRSHKMEGSKTKRQTDRAISAGLLVPKFNRFHTYLSLNIENMYWGVLHSSVSFVIGFSVAHPGRILTPLESYSLEKFSIFFNRLHEHVIMEAIGPSLNADSVKFSVNWELTPAQPTDVSYTIVNAITNEIIMSCASG